MNPTLNKILAVERFLNLEVIFSILIKIANFTDCLNSAYNFLFVISLVCI